MHEKLIDLLMIIFMIFFFFLRIGDCCYCVSGSQQHPGVSGNAHEWPGGCKGWQEGVNKVIHIFFSLFIYLFKLNFSDGIV